MKKVLLIIAAVVVFATAFTSIQDDKKQLARVNKILGKETYVLSEPLRDYDVVENLGTGWGTALLGRSTIQEQMTNIITRGKKKEEKGEFKFDAVVTTDGEQMALIKFKE